MFMRDSVHIHPTAIIHPTAHIGMGCHIGPYSLIGPGVVLEDYVHLDAHVSIVCHTLVGSGSRIGSFSLIGGDPQHMVYAGQETHLIIGKNARIREHVTIHRGTLEGGGITRVGNDVFLMVGVHIAHDCTVGDQVIMSNQATLGGHVQVDNHAVLGGLCAIHQFTRIGEGAMVAGFSGINADVIPYGLVMGYRAKLKGINRVKLKRLHASHEEIRAIYGAFLWIFKGTQGSFFQRVQTLPLEMTAFSRVQKIQKFLRQDMKRSICTTENGEDMDPIP